MLYKVFFGQSSTPILLINTTAALRTALYQVTVILISHKCIPPQQVKLEEVIQHDLALLRLNDFIILAINLRPGSTTADMCIRLWKVQLSEYYVTG